MSTIQQKLNKIESTILSEANAKSDEIISKALDMKNKKIEDTEMNVLQKLYKEINTETTKIRTKTTQYISRFEMKNKQILLEKRDELFQRVFEGISIRLSDFTKTQKYKDVFSDKISSLKDKFEIDKMKFYIKTDDKILKNIIIEQLGKNIDINEVSDITIGGFKTINTNTGVYIDETLDSKLEEQKPWFYANSKFVIDK